MLSCPPCRDVHAVAHGHPKTESAYDAVRLAAARVAAVEADVAALLMGEGCSAAIGSRAGGTDMAVVDDNEGMAYLDRLPRRLLRLYLPLSLILACSVDG